GQGAERRAAQGRVRVRADPGQRRRAAGVGLQRRQQPAGAVPVRGVGHGGAGGAGVRGGHRGVGQGRGRARHGLQHGARRVPGAAVDGALD
ncbi:hypothetical protein BN1708_020460, partial [Verticillium longisporum]